MARKRRKKGVQPAAPPQPAKRQVPKFEIGVKGDEFDVAYTRAAASESEKVSTLMSGLRRESKKSGVNLLSFSLLSLLLIIMSLSFAFLSRDASAPKLKPEKLADGSFLSELSGYYSDTLPFGGALKALGAKLGLGEAAEDADEHDPVPEEPLEPAVTTAAPIETEPATTTPPATTTLPTTVTAETTELIVPDTFKMYAQENMNVRLAPSIDSMIMGYFYTNERVDVIELGDDGWASIWYNNMVAYVNSEYLGESRVKITAATSATEEPVTTAPEETTEEPTYEITEAPEETEPEPEETTSVPETTAATTSTPRFASPEEAAEYYSRLAEERQSSANVDRAPPEVTQP